MFVVDTTIPITHVSKAIEELRICKESLVNDPACQELNEQIHQAITFIGHIQNDMNAILNTTGSDESCDEVVSDSAQIVPLESLLKPISKENPCGKNCRLSGEFNTLLSLVINKTRQSDFQPQYREAAQRSIELLSHTSKDLGIAVRLVEATVAIHGFIAAADGLILLNELLVRFWDDLYPQIEDGDCEPRANDLSRLQELLLPRLKAKYGLAHEFDPHYANREEAYEQKQALNTIIRQYKILNTFAHERFKDQAPDLNELYKTFDTYHNQVSKKWKLFADEDALRAKRKSTAEKEQVLSFLSDKKHEQILQEQKLLQQKLEDEVPKISLEPQSVEDAIERIGRCAQFLILHQPQDPLGYEINRCMQWFSLIGASEKGCPTAEQKKHIGQLLQEKEWRKLVITAEQIFTQGGAHWLDLQRYTIEAIKNCGKHYEPVTESLTQSIVRFVEKDPSILDRDLIDLSAAANTETKQWIASLLQTVSSSTEPQTIVQQTSPYEAIHESATQLAQKSDLSGALELWLTQENSAHSFREKFLWRLNLVEFCLLQNAARIALPSIELLVNWIDEKKLQQWESQELLIRVFKAGHDAYQKAFSTQKAPSDKVEFFYNRICTLNPAYFIQKLD